jgi:hypothetical protein
MGLSYAPSELAEPVVVVVVAVGPSRSAQQVHCRIGLALMLHARVLRSSLRMGYATVALRLFASSRGSDCDREWLGVEETSRVRGVLAVTLPICLLLRHSLACARLRYPLDPAFLTVILILRCDELAAFCLSFCSCFVTAHSHSCSSVPFLEHSRAMAACALTLTSTGT